jgi:hypothetical protein
MELTLEERVAALERKLLAREAAEEPAGYYTSKYSGEEIDALLGSSTRRNLLDNWYFVGGGSQQGGGQFPINQRAITSVNASNNLIDRWRIYRYVSGSATLTPNGINLSGDFDFGESIESARLPNIPNLPVTISALFSDGSFVSTTSILSNNGDSEFITVPISSNASLDYTRNWQSDIDLFAFSLKSNASIIPIAAKLELGSSQTLAYKDEGGNWQLFETPDYAEELAKCQRYFQLYSAADKRPAKAVDCRPTMRIDPTQGQLQINAQTLYYNSAEL